MILYRAVGQKEYDLIKESGFKRFPPRLPEQPIFYSVVTAEYAREIAEWNDVDIVLWFEVEDKFLAHYEIQTVGAWHHKEYWIPAEKLELFNDCIIGDIKVLEGDKE